MIHPPYTGVSIYRLHAHLNSGSRPRGRSRPRTCYGCALRSTGSSSPMDPQPYMDTKASRPGMIFSIIRIVFIIVSAERSVFSSWSTEIGCKLLQRVHFYSPPHYAMRNAVLWKSVGRFNNIDSMFCEKRATLCSYPGAFQIFLPVYRQRFLLTELARGVL